MHGLKRFFQNRSGVLLVLFLLLSSAALLSFYNNDTAEITLNWDQNGQKNLAGYKVYYGYGKSIYCVNVDAEQTKSFTIPDLEVGRTYYFAISTYDDSNRDERTDAKLFLDRLMEDNKKIENQKPL